MNDRKQVILTLEEKKMLQMCSVENLRLLVQIRDSGSLQALIQLANIVIDTNKNYFFREDETKLSAETLSLKHAYLRGENAGQLRLLYLIQGASSELLRREELTKKIKAKGGK